MPNPHFMILYVDSPAASAAFYADLLNQQPVQTSPTFVLFAMPSGLMLGLWSRQDVSPAATAESGCELAFTIGSPDAVDDTHAAWSGLGLKIVQHPTNMDFGRTFLALDPDGHRLRVFAPARDERNVGFCRLVPSKESRARTRDYGSRSDP